jgi:hypothetical protein
MTNLEDMFIFNERLFNFFLTLNSKGFLYEVLNYVINRGLKIQIDVHNAKVF